MQKKVGKSQIEKALNLLVPEIKKMLFNISGAGVVVHRRWNSGLEKIGLLILSDEHSQADEMIVFEQIADTIATKAMCKGGELLPEKTGKYVGFGCAKTKSLSVGVATGEIEKDREIARMVFSTISSLVRKN